MVTNVIPPADKETTITADHHVTKYVARVPNDATDDQIAKVADKLRSKLSPKQAMKPQSATIGPGGVISSSSTTGGTVQPMPAVDPVVVALEA